MNDAYSALEEMLVYRAVGGLRFTQGSPVMPDVWIHYGLHGQPLDLLMGPNWDSKSADLSRALEERLTRGLGDRQRNLVLGRVRLAHTQNAVAVTFTLAQLVRVALPLSRWWHHYLLEPRDGLPKGDLATLLASPTHREHLRESVLRGFEGKPFELNLETGKPARHTERHVTSDFVWMARIVGLLALLLKEHPRGLQEEDSPQKVVESLLRRPEAVLDAFLALLRGVQPPEPDQEPLWSVNRNRRVRMALIESMSTIKADAARRVFSVTGRDIRWAIVDSGIDATHLAFRRRNQDGQLVSRQPFSPRPGSADAPLDERQWQNHTRILATYDFTHARDLLSARNVEMVPMAVRQKLTQRGVQEALQAALETHMRGPGINWAQWEPVFRVPHTKQYLTSEVPVHKHGTHVAGILAADWRADDDADDAVEPSYLSQDRGGNRLGACPELELYDMRVMNEQGESDEFALMTALQFIRFLNAQHEHVEIHGANLSISLMHDVANHACGRTPICEECERLVGSGLVVVAAAGNNGRVRYIATEGGGFDEGYRSISITDPGNAPSVITVGATHRSQPHSYGVSYFSSRGPTGDGRLKPDLVAPGEKILSTVPGNREEPMDGTSMAAPHVSGAAALILCRHPEFIGKPNEVKRILCQTATDLGRERYFQGAGLLDILRALESV
jgi:serine protease AprX